MKLSNYRWLVPLLVLLAPVAGALPSDRGAPINVSANTAIQEKSKALYQGDVVITQGTLRIEAQEVEVFTENSRVSRIIATGAPARMQQKPQPDEEMVYASAFTIDYQVGADKVILTRQAAVLQAGSEIQGERIEYVIGEQVVKANAGDDNTGRVRMILQPEQEQP